MRGWSDPLGGGWIRKGDAGSAQGTPDLRGSTRRRHRRSRAGEALGAEEAQVGGAGLKLSAMEAKVGGARTGARGRRERGAWAGSAAGQFGREREGRERKREGERFLRVWQGYEFLMGLAH